MVTYLAFEAQHVTHKNEMMIAISHGSMMNRRSDYNVKWLNSSNAREVSSVFFSPGETSCPYNALDCTAHEDRDQSIIRGAHLIKRPFPSETA